jgi:chemotaxis protein MotB
MESSKRPIIIVKKKGGLKDPSGSGDKTGTTSSGASESVALTKDDMPKLKEKLEKAIQQIKDLDKLKNQIEITVTAEGLRIELLESTTSTFFDIGSPKLLRKPTEPLDVSNRRISMLVQNLETKEDAAKAESTSQKPPGSTPEKE